jgi:hypothetical protein
LALDLAIVLERVVRDIEAPQRMYLPASMIQGPAERNARWGLFVCLIALALFRARYRVAAAASINVFFPVILVANQR